MVVSCMARQIVLWLPSLTMVALCACGGSENAFFSDVLGGGTGSTSHAGAASSAGASSGGPGSAGSPGAGASGQNSAGDSSGGAQTSGASSGGASSGSANGGASAGSANGGGGAAGRTGAAGSGGTGASAGHAGAKGGSANGGSAGVAGSNQEPSCTELVKRASQQLEAARECNPNLEALQCTGKVTTQCGCQVPVQRTDSPESKAYLKTLKELEDKDCIVACTAIACMSVSNAQCRSSSSSSMGSCVATSHGSTF